MAPEVATNSVAFAAGHVGLVDVAIGADEVMVESELVVDFKPVLETIPDAVKEVEEEVADAVELVWGPRLKSLAPRRPAALTVLPIFRLR